MSINSEAPVMDANLGSFTHSFRRHPVMASVGSLCQFLEEQKGENTSLSERQKNMELL